MSVQGMMKAARVMEVSSVCALASTNTAMKQLLRPKNKLVTESFFKTFVPGYSKVTNFQAKQLTPLMPNAVIDRTNFKTPVITTFQTNYSGDIDILATDDTKVAKVEALGENGEFANARINSFQFLLYSENEFPINSKVSSARDAIITIPSSPNRQLIAVDLVKARQYLLRSNKKEADYDQLDWWYELLTNSNQYNNCPTIHLDYAVPTFFESAINEMDISTWPKSVRAEYHEELSSV